MKKIAPDFERILEAGNSAPSGENCQPWHFVVRGNEIGVHLLPNRDQSPYSWGQRAAYLANGAAIENIIIAASKEQYRAEVQYFPEANDEWHVATITLTKDAHVAPDPLAPFLSQRISNRKPYAKEALKSEDRKMFFAALAHLGFGELVLAEEREEIETLGRVGSTNEEVMLANQFLHQFFFSHVSWTKEEDDKKKVGFYIKTLELPPPVEIVFKIIRHWPIMRVLRALGFHHLVAKQNGATNASASAIGGFLITDTTPLDFVKIGRAIERVWLTATSLGLSFQALAGIPFFELRIVAGETEHFSPHQQKLILDACERARNVFRAKGKHVAFMFRIGYGPTPSAHAIRFPLAEAMTVK